LRVRYSYLFTTGGIGPTHDDITADAVAKALGVKIDHDPRVVAMLRARYGGADLNSARMRMTRMPAGADLVHNSVSTAPGFRIGNVIVMAGIPAIMQVMLDDAAKTLRTGRRMLSATIRADAREGDIGTPLAEIARAHPATMIGSYPFFDETRGPNTNIIVRSRDQASLAAATAAVESMLLALRADR
jgi:molybdopterin-biosynthesis enzyme MoeA-like protein